MLILFNPDIYGNSNNIKTGGNLMNWMIFLISDSFQKRFPDALLRQISESVRIYFESKKHDKTVTKGRKIWQEQTRSWIRRDRMMLEEIKGPAGLCQIGGEGQVKLYLLSRFET